VTLLSCPSIDERCLVSKVSHLCWINRTHNTYCWTSHTLDKTRSSHYASFNLCMHNGHTIEITISGVTPYLLTLMTTIYSASTTIIVIKNEDLELFSVKRQLISY
jgi:hypothetical protein